MSESLEDWIATQYRASARHLLLSVSPQPLIKRRPGFGQTVRAARGAIVASPVLADWDPEPDYFFHWFRDSALVVDALRLLYADGTLGEPALAHARDFVDFSLGLNALDARRAPVPRAQTCAEFQRYLRDEDEWRTVHGEAVLADTRVNADGSLDFTKWTRPQHDGAPLRALALLRWLQVADLGAPAHALLRADLTFVQRHALLPAYDIWEEEFGWHAYTLRVSAAALEAGAAWLDAKGEAGAAREALGVAAALRTRLQGLRDADSGALRSRELASGARSSKQLDSSVMLAAIHAREVDEPALRATLDALDALFAARYSINHGREKGYALGRYPGDAYHGGHPWFICTLAAAEFCYRSAQGDAVWRARGDAYLATLRAVTPRDGAMSEQFDGATGAPVSARHLAWSYAAFISCVNARRGVAA